jgi:hypothetical protein
MIQNCKEIDSLMDVLINKTLSHRVEWLYQKSDSIYFACFDIEDQFGNIETVAIEKDKNILHIPDEELEVDESKLEILKDAIVEFIQQRTNNLRMRQIIDLTSEINAL